MGNGDYAAKYCDANNCYFSDWFLPSKEELKKMYEVLHVNGIGDFSGEGYWSSSQYNSNHAYIVGFSNGKVTDAHMDSEFYVRPVREF